MNIQTALKEIFHLDQFRTGQKEIIESVLAGRDVLAVMPTGGGKSLCYQLPAFLGEGLTLVISPLIALMNDQVRALRDLQLGAGCIHSGLSLDEKKAVFHDLEGAKKMKKGYVLFLSPERVQKPGFATWLKSQNLRLFAIDEAHCVSQWGHDFRKEYGDLALLRKLRPEVPVLALTATATPNVKKDIQTQLEMKKPDRHVYGFYRPNLYYQIEFCTEDSEKEAFVVQALKQNPEGRILLYCGTRKKTESWAELLRERGAEVGFYHAGLSANERARIEEDYQRGNIRVLCATSAFGMGIDHPDIRLVVHTQMPGNLESYYQEVGRAGRDGKPSTCLLLYSKKDKGLHAFFITRSDASDRVKSLRWQALDAIVQFSEGAECRHGDILTYFKDEQRLRSCGHCDSCLSKSPRRIARVDIPNILRKSQKKKTKKKASLDQNISATDQWKVQILKDWRKAFAQENDIPAFMVFSDKTLTDLIIQAPENLEDMSQVYGMGEKKIALFGQKLLKELGQV